MHYLGLDPAKRHDYAAFGSLFDELENRAEFRRSLEGGGEPSLTRVYNLDGLSQTRNMSYPGIVERIVALVQDPRIGMEYTLVVDATGPGQPVVDMLREARVRVIPVTITGGQKVHADENGYNVPMAHLVSNLASLFESQRIKLPSLEKAAAANMPLARLQEQVEHFSAKATPRGNISFGADEDEVHDDLVICIALPLWYAEYTSGFQSTEWIVQPQREPYDPRKWLRR